MMKEKGHFPFFDMAYQGFASGDCVRDAQVHISPDTLRARL